VLRAVTCLTALAVIGGLSVGPALAVAPPSARVMLDTHELGNDGAAGPVSVRTFPAGTVLQVTVEGTFSAWKKWPSRRCGSPDPTPIHDSPGVADTPAGYDANFRYAQPQLRVGSACPRLPAKASVFQIDAGSGWTHPAPLGGMPSAPDPDGTYVYEFVSNGQPLRFRLIDHHTDDNNGRFAITVASK
jgi:hypothetical protein